jgi:hypothetical protein
LGLFDLDTRKAQAQSVTSFPSLRQIQWAFLSQTQFNYLLCDLI